MGSMKPSLLVGGLSVFKSETLSRETEDLLDSNILQIAEEP
jgi:hypothetical protein